MTAANIGLWHRSCGSSGSVCIENVALCEGEKQRRRNGEKRRSAAAWRRQATRGARSKRKDGGV